MNNRFFYSRYKKNKTGGTKRKVSGIQADKIILAFVLLLLFCVLLSAFYFKGFDHKISGDTPGFRVMIDAGHFKGSLNGTQYKDRLEYKITPLISRRVRDIILKERPEWYVEISREGDNYTDKIRNFRMDNYDSIRKEAEKNLKIAKSRYRYMRKWSQPVLKKWIIDRVNLISVRNYSEKNFDILVSVHFNYPGDRYFSMKYRGFCIFVSQENTYYDESRKFAGILRKNLLEFHRISNFGGEGKKKGIVIDTYAILGTKYRRGNLPSIILETEYIMHDICDDPVFHDNVAGAIFKSLDEYFIWYKKMKKNSTLCLTVGNLFFNLI